MSEEQFAIFEVRLTAIDKPAERRRWNGDPMPSSEASATLRKAVDAFREAVAAEGFEIVRTGFGVMATEKIHV